MESPGQVLEAGTRIRTHAALGTTKGMLVVGRHLSARKADALGIIDGYVPGHGGDVYFVRHSSTPTPPVAVYAYTEFELEPAS